jgi:hypothetical protein
MKRAVPPSWYIPRDYDERLNNGQDKKQRAWKAGKEDRARKRVHEKGWD